MNWIELNKPGAVIRGRAGRRADGREYWCHAAPHTAQAVRWGVEEMVPMGNGVKGNTFLWYVDVPLGDDPTILISERLGTIGVQSVEFDVPRRPE